MGSSVNPQRMFLLYIILAFYKLKSLRSIHFTHLLEPWNFRPLGPIIISRAQPSR
jgi:hypothetical protein